MSAAEVEQVTVVETVEQVRREVEAARRNGDRIGLVPTMGAMHEGHLSLIRAARQACDFVAVSIFVNPTQFGPHEDLDRYPRPFEADLRACAEEGVDLVFHPCVETIYPPGSSTIVEVEGLSQILEGKYRPGHFRGVTTVVLKLFNIVAPDVAYFGRKDYQQQLIIRRMCRELCLPMTIETCPTVRESDGLALSSRNVYLNDEERQTALTLSRCLQHACDLIRQGETDLDRVRLQMREQIAAVPEIDLDYTTVADAESLAETNRANGPLVALIAARVGNTRLIDNMLME